MSLVSIVTPVYNGERYLAECIESVLSQSHQEWELLVVDDGSTDRSAEIASEYADQDARIRLLFHDCRKNCGVSLSRRLGIASSSGEFVAFLDADDAFTSGKLEQQLAVAREHPEAVVFHAGAICVDESSEERHGLNWADSFNAFAEQARVYSFRDEQEFLVQNGVLNSSVLIRKEALAGIPYGFDQLFQYEDWTLWVLLSELGLFYVQPDRLIRYRMHEGSATHSVVNSPLVETYSYIEFLLSVLAFSRQSEVRKRAAQLLEKKLGTAVEHYRNDSAANDEIGGSTIGLATDRILQTSIVPRSTQKKKKWYRRFLTTRVCETQ